MYSTIGPCAACIAGTANVAVVTRTAEVANGTAVSCGEEEVVRGVHTLIAGVVQVYHRLHVGEEEEKGRKVEQEVEREDQGEEITHTWMTMWMR